MKIKLSDFSVNFVDINPSSSLSIIFLHGFTGSINDWEYIFNYLPTDLRIIAIDLPGHGHSSSIDKVKYYTIEFISRIIDAVTSELELNKFSLCGYSMGGRVALNYSITHQNLISKLILISSTAGIEKKNDQQMRIESDEMLCSMIEKNGIDYFVDYWKNLPLFSSLKRIDSNIYNSIIEQKKQNTSTGLVNSLRGFGTGKMIPMWDSLDKLTLETLLVCGELDKKFININTEMNQKIINSKLRIIPNVGHNVCMENPGELSDLLINFISQKLFRG